MVDRPRPEDSTETHLEFCLVEVEQSPDFHLSFGSRRQLLISLGEPARDPEALPRSQGQVRRAMLALLVAERVLPIWEAAIPHPHPHRLLAASRTVLDANGPPGDLEEKAYAFLGAITSPPPELLTASYVGQAAVCAAYVTVFDELLRPGEGLAMADLEDPQDPDLWDCAVWAAAAAAGDFPWGSGSFEKERNREFWRWYLNEAVPSV